MATSKQPLDILIVDDEEVVRSVVAEILSLEGHHIHTAGSAQEALTCLVNEKIDLVITDVCMPQMDGLELAAIIRRAHPAVHVVLMSGYCPDTSRITSAELHIEGFVSKPFRLVAIISAVNAIAAGAAYSS